MNEVQCGLGHNTLNMASLSVLWYILTRKGGSCNALPLEGLPTSHQAAGFNYDAHNAPWQTNLTLLQPHVDAATAISSQIRIF